MKVKEHSYIFTPLFPGAVFPSCLFRICFGFNVAGRVYFYETLPDVEFIRLGSVIRYWQQPVIVIGRRKFPGADVQWWKPIKKFGLNFVEVPF